MKCQNSIFKWESISTYIYCMLCMMPGLIVLQNFEANGISIIPLFWGGMYFQKHWG